jgi:hypothetical protein
MPMPMPIGIEIGNTEGPNDPTNAPGGAQVPRGTQGPGAAGAPQKNDMEGMVKAAVEAGMESAHDAHWKLESAYPGQTRIPAVPSHAPAHRINGARSRMDTAPVVQFLALRRAQSRRVASKGHLGISSPIRCTLMYQGAPLMCQGAPWKFKTRPSWQGLARALLVARRCSLHPPAGRKRPCTCWLLSLHAVQQLPMQPVPAL